MAPLPSKSPAFEMCFFRLSHRDPGRETASGEKRANRDEGPPENRRASSKSNRW
ncbi:hypothetical protein SZ54_4369 [Rhizobium sp. UR51a]|nr:hypothetical protein SZ54_4369 [Rhizobium sp. UR51a]